MRILLPLLFWVLPTFAQQQFTFEHITTEQGLSQNSINCILQDRDGYMWFGTYEGLNRYDGLSFTQYKRQNADTLSLSDNAAMALAVDLDGDIWVGTWSGVDRLHPGTGKVKRYTINHETAINANKVRALFIDTVPAYTNNGKEKVIWIGMMETGLYKLTIRGEQEELIHYLHSDSLPGSIGSNTVNSISRDAAGRLWLGLNNTCLDQYISSTNTFVHHYLDSITNGGIGQMLVDSKQRMWLGVYNRGVYQASFEGGSATDSVTHFSFIPIQKGIIKNIPNHFLPTGFVEDPHGNIWVGFFQGGIRIFKPHNDGTFEEENILPDKTSSSGLSGMDISELYLDKSNILWVGSGNYGLNKTQLDKQVMLYQHHSTDSFSLPSQSVRGIYKRRNGTLLVGGYGQLAIFDNRTPPPSFVARNRHTLQVTGKGPQPVYAISPDPVFGDSIVWLGLEGGGLIRYNEPGKPFKSFHARYGGSTGLLTDYIFSLYPEKNGTLWIGTPDGLQSLDVRGWQSPKFTTYRNEINNPASLGVGVIYSIKRSSSGVLWVGGNGCGINAMLPSEPDRFLHFIHDPKDSTSLSYDDVRCICEDHLGRMWFGTNGGGLNLLLPDGKTFKHITGRDGLPSETIYGILEDSTGNLWLSTNKGLSRYTPSTGMVWNITKKDGLQDNEFNSGSYFKTEQGELFFGGINGLNSFFADKLVPNAHVPPVHITSLKIFGKEILTDAILITVPLSLAYDQDVLTFTFTALDYVAPERNQFKYRLDGADNNWVNAGTLREVSYAHLSPGSYVFRVIGSNNDGVWNEQGASLAFIIHPPFWRTWWFTTLAALFVLGIIGWTVRSVERRKAQEKIRIMEKEFALEKERLRISKDIHDDIGSRLTHLGIMSERLKRGAVNEDVFKSSLTDISQATNDVVDSLDEIVWAVNPKYDTMDNLVYYIAEYCSKYLEKANLECSLDIPPLPQNLKISTELRHNIFMITKECLNNILKHAEATEVRIIFTITDKQFSMEMADNGKGFLLDETKKFSEGLVNMKKRMEDVGGESIITSKPGSGTVVKLSIALPAIV